MRFIPAFFVYTDYPQRNVEIPKIQKALPCEIIHGRCRAIFLTPQSALMDLGAECGVDAKGCVPILVS